MPAEFSRRTFIKHAAAGSAAVMPAVASAAPGRRPPDPAQPSPYLVFALEKLDGLAAQRKLIAAQIAVLDEMPDAKPVSYHSLVCVEEELFEAACRLEDEISDFPCANAADMMLKVEFIRHHAFDEEGGLDYALWHARVLKSAFHLVSEANGGKGVRHGTAFGS